MFKIIYIVSTLKKCGPINVLLNIIKELDRSVYKPIIITLSEEGTDTAIQEFYNRNVEVYSLNLTRTEGIFKTKKKVNSLINKLNPSIIHTHGIRADRIGAKYFKKHLVISTIHSYPYFDYPLTYGLILGHGMAFMHTRYLRKLTLAVSCSNSIKNNMLKKNVESIYIHNGIDMGEKRQIHSSKDNLRTNLNLPVDKKIFISVGHLSKLKDPLTIIKSLIVNEYKDNLYFVFLGNGEEKEKCQNLIDQYNLPVLLAGQVSNVQDYLYAADYFVSASLGEGMPNSVLEALSSSLPVLLSNIESHKEILEMNKCSGVIFKTQDTESLNQAIFKLINLDRKTLSKSAIITYNDYFTSKVMSTKYQIEYMRLIKKKGIY
ncbi:glycosyltransferase [Priestia megaterium]|uniref:glycosyltransferase n=1 Tax=Priestia megaterium TaxID=1404 RepID=UPI00234E977F|nr:glycosyltransferase [Priestia megaterium]MDC7771441.1 glycosyltransferase [Priestia megaterium]